MASTPASSSPRTSRRARLGAALLAAALVTTAACQRDKGKPATTTTEPGGSVAADGVIDLDSKDILARPANPGPVDVKHVLIAWDKLSSVYGPQMDQRAAARDNKAAATLAKDVAAKLKARPDSIDALVTEFGEDPGAKSGEPYTVAADGPFVPEFKNLALRLNVGETGIVKTRFGYHVITRIAPPPPDPLESADILARPAGTEKVWVQHVLVSWKDAPAAKRRPPDPRAAERTKADADKLASEVLAKVKAGDDMTALMKEFSEDPGSKDGKPYDVGPDTPFVPEFKNLSLRLNLGEAGLVKTAFGWHIIKRIPPPPPPPPDALDSVDILGRQPVTEKAKVKHILLGWSEVNAGDERGKKRTRAELDALVKKTMASLKKGAKIEPLMKELSEDPGSAANGNSYDVDPNAGLVAPFKDLSLRLNVNEVGAVKTQFGIHIIQRVE